MASSVVAAHNHVLRRWLRGDTSSPIEEVDAAMAQVVALFSTPTGGADRGEGTTVVVFRTGESLESVVPALRRVVGADESAPDRNA